MRVHHPLLAAAAAAVVAAACAKPTPAPLPPPTEPPPPAAFDPSSGCQRALAHVVALSLRATGAGPSDRQRTLFLNRCVEARAPRGPECVLKLRSLPGRRGGEVGLGPALDCLQGG
jgi:hypothetical protein